MGGSGHKPQNHMLCGDLVLCRVIRGQQSPSECSSAPIFLMSFDLEEMYIVSFGPYIPGTVNIISIINLSPSPSEFGVGICCRLNQPPSFWLLKNRWQRYLFCLLTFIPHISWCMNEHHAWVNLNDSIINSSSRTLHYWEVPCPDFSWATVFFASLVKPKNRAMTTIWRVGGRVGRE